MAKKVAVDLELLKKYIEELDNLSDELVEFTFSEEESNKCKGKMAEETKKAIDTLNNLRKEYVVMVKDTSKILKKYKKSVEQNEKKAAININMS